MIRRLALLLALLPAAAAAQPNVSVGTSATLGHRQFLDVPMQCCPLWTWVEFGSGRARFHLDYLYSYRESEGYGGYPLDGDSGNGETFGFGGPVENASLQWHDLRVVRRHEASAMWVWPARQRPEYTLNVLIGMAFASSDVNDCKAQEGPIEQVIPTPEEYSYDPNYIVYEWRLTEGDRGRCRESKGRLWSQAGVGPNAAVTLDVPLGERAYFRVGYRLLFQAAVGFGVRF